MLDISPIYAFTDNFIWLIKGPDGRFGAVVDPGDASPVLKRVQSEGIELCAIIITHKHGDHVGGVRQLLAEYPNAVVYGPANEPIPGITHRLQDADHIVIDAIEAEFSVMDVPGHTEGHIAYYYEQGTQRVLFCGDTLFSVGCGRVFSGTHEQLHDSLMRIANLPDDTLAYCAHEYTLDNIGFAKWVEPDNQTLLQREQEAHEQLQHDSQTVPTTLQMEKATNPFLRVKQAQVIDAAERYKKRKMRHSRDTFEVIRRWKDREYD
jgi:hydroxyacylglutathione hydrolase